MCRSARTIVSLLVITLVVSLSPRTATSATIGTKVIRGAAIGFAVSKFAKPLDSFINTVTLRHDMKSNLGTKVVPILSVGEKGYIGGAQVSGPRALVNRVQAVFQYEKNFSNNNYRAKILLPSAGINPLKLERVQKVGVSAIIDVALDGQLKFNTVGTGIQTGDVIRGAALLVAVKNFGPTINKGLNTITFNSGLATKVVPMGSFGEKAYLGGAQVSAAAGTINAVNAVWQYEDLFSGGQFRVKILVPTTSSNPLKMKRVDGAGITAVIDMALSEQKNADAPRRDPWRVLSGTRGKLIRYNPNPGDRGDDREDYRPNWPHDNGKHKGWFKQKNKEREKDRDDDNEQ